MATIFNGPVITAIVVPSARVANDQPVLNALILYPPPPRPPDPPNPLWAASVM